MDEYGLARKLAPPARDGALRLWRQREVLRPGGNRRPPAEVRTIGVEEEFLLIRPDSAHLVPAGDAVVAAAEGRSHGQFVHEFMREQAELATSPHASLGELADELKQRRAELAESARDRGIRLAALATSPWDSTCSLTTDERYERMATLMGRVARLQLTCGMHVHVGVSSGDEGVGVVDRIRPWLSVLIALSANSPYLCGEDTGYASYRTIRWSAWPTFGVTEPFGDLAHYRAACATLIRSGAAIDTGMIYFGARLSDRYPTVEVRVADVCPHAADAVTIAALVRGMVSAAAREWARGEPVQAIRADLLRTAMWRASRCGMDRGLVDARCGEVVGAWHLVDALVDWVRPALEETGDRGLVEEGLAAIRRRGTGATLQREAYARSGDFNAMMDAVAMQTLR